MHWKGAAQVFILSGHTRIFKLLQVMFIASVALLTQKHCRSQKRHQSLSFNSPKKHKKSWYIDRFLVAKYVYDMFGVQVFRKQK